MWWSWRQCTYSTLLDFISNPSKLVLHIEACRNSNPLWNFSIFRWTAGWRNSDICGSTARHSLSLSSLLLVCLSLLCSSMFTLLILLLAYLTLLCNVSVSNLHFWLPESCHRCSSISGEISASNLRCWSPDSCHETPLSDSNVHCWFPESYRKCSSLSCAVSASNMRCWLSESTPFLSVQTVPHTWLYPSACVCYSVPLYFKQCLASGSIPLSAYLLLFNCFRHLQLSLSLSLSA